jgi:hypothetical protein
MVVLHGAMILHDFTGQGAQRRSQYIDFVGLELICGVKEVVMSKFTHYFNFLQHILHGFAKKLWGQLTPQLVHGSATGGAVFQN